MLPSISSLLWSFWFFGHKTKRWKSGVVPQTVGGFQIVSLPHKDNVIPFSSQTSQIETWFRFPWVKRMDFLCLSRCHRSLIERGMGDMSHPWIQSFGLDPKGPNIIQPLSNCPPFIPRPSCVLNFSLRKPSNLRLGHSLIIHFSLSLCTVQWSIPGYDLWHSYVRIMRDCPHLTDTTVINLTPFPLFSSASGPGFLFNLEPQILINATFSSKKHTSHTQTRMFWQLMIV